MECLWCPLGYTLDVLVVAAVQLRGLSTQLLLKLSFSRLAWCSAASVDSVTCIACTGSCCCFLHNVTFFVLRSLPQLKLLSWLLECDRSIGVA